MEEERMDRNKVYPDLITVTTEFGEIFLDLHHNLTIDSAKKKAIINDKSTCLVLTPQNSLALATGLIDAVFISKVQKEAVAKEELPYEK